jgi:hypothetical protein
LGSVQQAAAEEGGQRRGLRQQLVADQVAAQDEEQVHTGPADAADRAEVAAAGHQP